jgi:hypothetical protein
LLERRDLAGLAREHEARLALEAEPTTGEFLLFESSSEHRVLLAEVTLDPFAAYARQAKVEAAYDGLRIQLGCELYRREHGHAPATLKALAPTYLPAPPPDPWAPGQPLQYAAGRAWSVGQQVPYEVAPLPAPNGLDLPD